MCCSKHSGAYTILCHLVLSHAPDASVAEIWDALRAAAEADGQTALTYLETAGIINHNDDMSVCYDERGTSCG